MKRPDRPAAEHRDRAAGEVLRARREDGVAEGLLEARDLGRQLRAVVPPHDRGGDRRVVGEASVAVDAEDPRALAHVRAPGAAVEAGAAGHVALGGDVVALGDVAHLAPDGDDRPAELVAERQRRAGCARTTTGPSG